MPLKPLSVILSTFSISAFNYAYDIFSRYLTVLVFLIAFLKHR